MRFAGLARSSFYYQRKILQIVDKHVELRTRIRGNFDQHRGRYGYRRITGELRRLGHGVNHKTVQKLMVEMQLKSFSRPKRYKAFEGANAEAAPNHLKRDFDAAQPNEKWVTDVTEFKVNNRKLYLSPVMDLYNREIVSYEIAERPLPTMIENMLTKAIGRLDSHERPILHSDQGWQYRMPFFRQRLQREGLVQSMSRKGNCSDNAAMESFFGTLKCEFQGRLRRPGGGLQNSNIKSTVSKHWGVGPDFAGSIRPIASSSSSPGEAVAPDGLVVDVSEEALDHV